MKFVTISLFVALSATAAQAKSHIYACRTMPLIENKAGIPKLSFTLEANDSGTRRDQDGVDFSVSDIPGYTYESLGSEEGGVSEHDTYTEIFMNNGCDSIVRINFLNEDFARVAAGKIGEVTGLLAFAGVSGEKPLKNVTISCRRQ
jgi:hypothetical protein